ncbi:WD40/YVTN/BNR-like repeat-containing protein [Sphingomonas sp. M1A8_2b]
MTRTCARRRGFAAILLIVLSAQGWSRPPAAIPYHWTSVKVGAGGYAPNIVFSEVERGLAYLRTDMGGAYRWDDAAQGWLPLQDGNATPSYMGIESIAPDPRNADIVYMAAGMGASQPAAILRSVDRGRSWRTTPVPFAMGGNEDGRGMGERLAVDPNDTRTLFFGSRHDGLWRSSDAGTTWAKVASFPVAGLGKPAPRTTHGGVSFVAIDGTSGSPGNGSRRLWAGIADPGAANLYRSDDGGRTWRAAEGPKLFAGKGIIDRRGVLWVGYASGLGPSGIGTGAVWRYDPSGRGRDVTPAAWRATGAEGAFLGVAVSRSDPGTVVVSTVDRYRHGDSVWISRDDGRRWDDLGARSRRDVSATPFLLHEGKGADFGHWISGLAIDPFDPARIAYTTGATVYATRAANRTGTIGWSPWVRGIEQTAIITLVSPTGGAPLISGFGDLAGFVHADLDRSPQPTFVDPYMSNTNALDYAGLAPNVIVRSGSLYLDRSRDGSLGRSEDGGRTWTMVTVPPMGSPPKREDLNGDWPITVSADGATIVVATPIPQMTRDRGRSWTPVRGLPGKTRAVADKRDPLMFYAVDVEHGRLLVSRDAAASFAPVAGHGLPTQLQPVGRQGREAQSAIVAAPDSAGTVWLQAGDRLFRSPDGGGTFVAASGALHVELYGLGKNGVFAVGTLDGVRGVWRSIDDGQTWSRIDDDDHRWGGRYRVISGDPRREGRVYLGTDGRGLFYGDPRGIQ